MFFRASVFEEQVLIFIRSPCAPLKTFSFYLFFFFLKITRLPFKLCSFLFYFFLLFTHFYLFGIFRSRVAASVFFSPKCIIFTGVLILWCFPPFFKYFYIYLKWDFPTRMPFSFFYRCIPRKNFIVIWFKIISSASFPFLLFYCKCFVIR